MRCGLLGRRLGHSYSPEIHASLGDYSYTLFEKEPEEVERFLKNEDFDGINVTIPYKTAVIPFLDDLSPLARRLGAVNTIVRREGRLIGHNTDYFGFSRLVRESGLDPAGKKCLVLGTGGASKPVIAVLEEMGGRVTVISHRENTPENLKNHADAAILVNTTPVGMYPNNLESPVDLGLFPDLEGVLDLIFNPARTALMLRAESRGIVAMGGLWMLVAQAKESAEWFLGRPIGDEVTASIHRQLRQKLENIILIGMPGSGKSTVGRLLAQTLHRPFVDADGEIEALAGKSIPEIFARDGEEAFRALETRVLEAQGKRSGIVLATGGGCVTRPENYAPLHQNGTLFWLRRDLAALPTAGRPLSQAGSLSEMYARRAPLYASFGDYPIDNEESPDRAAGAIRTIWEDSL